MNLNLPVRYWPCCPRPEVPLAAYDEKALAYGQATLELPVTQTAFMLVDCWNLTKDGPPVVPGVPKYWDYNFVAGGASWLARAETIVQTRIRPCLEQARHLGMTVLHGPSSYIAGHYPQCQTLAAAVPEPSPKPPRPWPPPEFISARWERFMKWRYGDDCTAHWNRLRPAMDIAAPLKPLADEIVFSTLAQVQHVLAERRILNLVVVGFATNACLLLKPGAIVDLSAAGYEIIVLRDGTTGIEAPWSVDDLSATRATLDHIEMAYGYTATCAEFLAAAGGK
jgi:nicotinamidase-related amidase